MDLPIRPKPCNVRIAEHRETVYELHQPEYKAVKHPDGNVTAVLTGRHRRGMTCIELKTAMRYAPNGASVRAEYVVRQGVTK
jgi:hypothetical protein